MGQKRLRTTAFKLLEYKDKKARIIALILHDPSSNHTLLNIVLLNKDFTLSKM